MPADVKLRMKLALVRSHQLACTALKRPFPLPSLSFDLRGKTAGTAHCGKWHVQLNSTLLLENQVEFERQVIPHELAHLYTHAVFGPRVSAHGKEWRHVMRLLGVAPERTHQMDVSNSAVQSRLYRYRCACKEFELSARKHAGLKKNRRKVLACKACGSVLSFTGEARVAGEWTQIAPKVHTSAAASAARPPARQPASPASSVDRRGVAPEVLNELRRLVRTLNAVVSPAVFTDARAASDILRLLRLQAAALPQGLPANRASGQAGPSRLSTPASPPTERQLAYARDIAHRKKLSLPESALVDRKSLSAWIERHWR